MTSECLLVEGVSDTFMCSNLKDSVKVCSTRVWGMSVSKTCLAQTQHGIGSVCAS